MAIFSLFVAAALSLGGVTGESLKARAFFDINNAKVGDPLVLTIDFIGTADFAGLHPPSLARAVDKRDWKIDAASAKTDTFRDAKRLTWRIRPCREGVLWFPALSFAYSDATGGTRIVTANAIPVHAKRQEMDAKDVVGAEMGRDETSMPQPDALIVDAPELRTLSDDARFAWRKACAKPTADAFAAFDFPSAKLNEARCAILAGDWKRAMGVYARLEWRTGQTPAIERGMLAALAVKYANPLVELPVWRQVGRPLLKYDWRGRVGWVAGSVLAVVAILLLLGKLVRALAVIALAVVLAGGLTSVSAVAGTVTTTTTNANGSVTVKTVETDAQGRVISTRVSTSSSGGSSFSFSSSSGGGMRQMQMGSPFGGRDPFSLFDDFDPFGSRRRARARYPKVEIGVSLVCDKPSVTVGEDFNLILTLDTPQFINFAEGIRFGLDEQDALVQTSQPQTLRPERSRNPTNVLQRIRFPMRANRPLKGLHYTVASSYLYRGDHSFFAQTTPWSSGPRTARFTANEPPAKGRPADWNGIVATEIRLTESCDLLRPETNDVVTVTYRLDWKGYVPPDWMPKDAAYEWSRTADGACGTAEWRRYVVADGVPATPKVGYSWYDPRQRRYRHAESSGTRLSYRTAVK